MMRPGALFVVAVALLAIAGPASAHKAEDQLDELVLAGVQPVADPAGRSLLAAPGGYGGYGAGGYGAGGYGAGEYGAGGYGYGKKPEGVDLAKPSELSPPSPAPGAIPTIESQPKSAAKSSSTAAATGLLSLVVAAAAAALL